MPSNCPKNPDPNLEVASYNMGSSILSKHVLVPNGDSGVRAVWDLFGNVEHIRSARDPVKDRFRAQRHSRSVLLLTRRTRKDDIAQMPGSQERPRRRKCFQTEARATRQVPGRTKTDVL